MYSLIKIVLISLTLSLPVYAQNCNDKFLNSYIPEVKYNQEICYNKFVVLYNYDYKIPMISAEYLTAQDIALAKTLQRKNTFHVDSTIPVQYNQTIASYKNTGYDKGHMTPNGDADSTDDQFQTFSLANMTPQTKKLNEIVWKQFEEKVRKDVTANGSAYIVTGSIVISKKIMTNGIVVPDYIYKAVYFPSTKQSVVYVGKNDDSMESEILSSDTFQQKYNIRIFK